MTVLTQVM